MSNILVVQLGREEQIAEMGREESEGRKKESQSKQV